MFGHDEHTSDRIPNLSFRRSIQTLSPDLRQCIANVIESRDIRDAKSGRNDVSLWHGIHVDDRDRARENCAYGLMSFHPRDPVRLESNNIPEVYFIGVFFTSRPCIAGRPRATNSNTLLP